MPTYRCPVCKKPLSQKEYESALGILESREAHLKHREQELEKRESELRKQKDIWMRKAKTARQEGLEEGRRKEKERAERLFQGKDKQIKKLQERIEQLQKGTTPQTDGLEFEETLYVRLQHEFPDDDIQHEGKGGDVLHFVMLNGEQAGVIVYECKRTPNIPSSHVSQASRAKQQREADFAVLVTTGQRKKFSGLDEENGVLIVSPLGVIPLAALLRGHLIEMLKAKVSKEKRVRIANQLLKYVTSPQFKNPIEEVVTKTGELTGLLKEEARQHAKMWTTRWEHYQRIRWDSSQIQANLQLVLQGKEPKPLAYPKPAPLQLLPPRAK
jgi:hypothetical protein